VEGMAGGSNKREEERKKGGGEKGHECDYWCNKIMTTDWQHTQTLKLRKQFHLK
jgi:hypothetical protein